MSLSYYVELIIAPLGSALLLGLLSLLLFWRRRGPVAVYCVTAALTWLWIWSTPAASVALRSRIESQHPDVPVASLPPADAIVVLGGSVTPPEDQGQDVD